MPVTNPHLTVSLHGQQYTLTWDMAAILELCRMFGVDRGELRGLLVSHRSGPQQIELLMKLVFCMTRSNDNPPTMKDIERSAPGEIFALAKTVNQLIEVGETGGLGKDFAEIASPAADGASSGIGVAPSRRRSTAVASRRRSSGGLRRSN